MASTNAVLSTIIGPLGTSPSRRTLDLDSLTYQTLFLRSQVGMNPFEYYLPIIPGDGTVVKQLDYYTIQQALSVGGFYLTTSTIGDLITEVTALSSYQLVTNSNVSSVSTIVGSNILTLSRSISTYQGTINLVTFTPAYNAMKSSYDYAVSTNSTANSIQSNVTFLTSGLSSLSTAITSSFTWLNTRVETVFNQGPAVSSLSTFVFEYYNYLSESVSSYSTSVGAGISTNSNYQMSTLIGYSNLVAISLANGTGPGVSSLSTIITSTFLSTQVTLISYNPGPGMSSISSYVIPALSSFSTQFNIQLAIPGICSLSTYYTESYSTSIAYAREQSGVFGISTLNSTLSTQGGLILANIDAAANLPLSSFSTVVYTELNMISDIICTIGFTYTILQQELVKTSISTVSTSFGIQYTNMTSLSTYSTMLDPAYSTLYQYFNVSSPYNSISTLSTIQQSTILGTTAYLDTIYPQIFTGPGISSISTNQPIEISSLSTSLGRVFSTFSNDIYNISSIRADAGISSLSSFLVYSTIQIQSTADGIASVIDFLNLSTTYLQESISDLRGFDSTVYGSLELSSIIQDLTLQFLSTSLFISSVSLYYENITSSMSSYISTNTASTTLLYGELVSSFQSTTSSLFSDYILVSSLASTNLFYPVFSTFYADLVFTSSLKAYNQMEISSLILNKNPAFPQLPLYTNLFLYGTMNLESQRYFGTPYVFATSNFNGNTIYIANSATGALEPSDSLNQFTGEANDVLFSQTIHGLGLWVVCGSNTGGTGLIKYSEDPVNSWTDSVIIPSPITSVTSLAFNGDFFLAGATGATTILSSGDGQTWNNAATPVFPNLFVSTLTKVNKLAYDGTRWVGVGSNTLPYTAIYADNNLQWKSGGNTFSQEGRGVTTNGRVWVAVGSPEPLKYSFNGRSWFNAIGVNLSTLGNAVHWNGEKFVAVGQTTNNSNILYSFNGQSWQIANSGFGYAGQTITWDGSNWIASGIDTVSATSSKLLYSPDGITWSQNLNAPNTILRGSAFASNIQPAITMTHFEIFSGNIPAPFRSNGKRRLQVIQSTISFNDGNFVIRQDTNDGVGYVGINQAYPEYALDIGIGNARKPSGTTWVTSSDARVKTNITAVDTFSCAQTLLQIPLRQFSYTESYRQQTGIRDIPYYGFIAQEVKQVLPDSVRISNEFGLPDFHSLDADQLFKIEFGATQYLMKAIEEVEQKLSTLESYQKNR